MEYSREVVVDGEWPGVFIIDNACFGMIAANEDFDWVGRPVEYEDAHMRFLDHAADETGISGLWSQPLSAWATGDKKTQTIWNVRGAAKPRSV